MEKPVYNPLDADREAGAEPPAKDATPKLPSARKQVRDYATRDLTPVRTGKGYVTK